MVHVQADRLEGHIDLCLFHWPGDPASTDGKQAISKRAAIWRALETA
jgi:diketogulonate reductase-like aldo/keto reductase